MRSVHRGARHNMFGLALAHIPDTLWFQYPKSIDSPGWLLLLEEIRS